LATSAWERPVCSTTLPKPRAGRRHPHVGCQAAVDTPMDHPPAVLAIGTRSHAFSDRRAAAHASRQALSTDKRTGQTTDAVAGIPTP
jgi:hypothetical protein